ncbi:MAG: hypothetical protein QOK31_1344 [Solirubrobacteraceae bacterium]|nr:hypothetical protein [Solirubrobacteraceae bacterium]
MRIVLKRPPKSRAKTFAKVFGAVGGTLGSLPVTIRPGSRGGTVPKRSAAAAKIAAPAAAVIGLGAVLLRRRGRNAPEPASAQTAYTPSDNGAAAAPEPATAGDATPPEALPPEALEAPAGESNGST